MLKNILKKLVSFKTITQDRKTNFAALKWCAGELKKTGLKTQFLKSNGFVSLFAGKNLSFKPEILLAGHVDVVSAPAELFKLKETNGRLIGRGVFDMKYALACYLLLARELRGCLRKTAILFTSDEEVGGKNGTGYFVNNRVLPKMCVIPDGGKNFVFERSAKGILQLKILSSGKSAHGSRPWEGDNALEKLVECLSRLKKIFPKEPCKDKLHRHTSISINVLNAGTQTNLIPDLAEALVDIRVDTSSSLAQVRAGVLQVAEKYAGVSVLEQNSAEPFMVDTKNKYLLLFAKLTRNRLGKNLEFLDSPGTCDARYFVNKRVPCVVLRPEGGGHHTQNEWVQKDSLYEFYGILKRFVFEIENSRTF